MEFCSSKHGVNPCMDSSPPVSTTPVPAFRMRNVLCEHSMEKPCAMWRNGEPASSSDPYHVPVLHIFGILENGAKCCVHVHGVLPYLLVRVGEMGGATARAVATRIDAMLNEGEPRKRQHVWRVDGCSRRSIYGYHSDEEAFAKVSFLLPSACVKASKVLGAHAARRPHLQPFEAHLPFHLQFFIDHSIFGMDWIAFRSVKWRVREDLRKEAGQCGGEAKRKRTNDVIYDGVTVGAVLDDPSLLSPHAPATRCAVECDVRAEDILNPILHEKNVYSSNPGLESLWEEERERCERDGRLLEDTFSNYPPNPLPPTPEERDEMRKWREVARRLRAEGAGRADLTQSLNDTISPAEASFADEVDRAWREQQQPEQMLEEEEEEQEKEKEQESEEEEEWAEGDMTQIMEEVAEEQYPEDAMEEVLSVSDAVTLYSQMSEEKEEEGGEGEQAVEEEERSAGVFGVAATRGWRTLSRQLPLRCRSDTQSQRERRGERQEEEEGGGTQQLTEKSFANAGVLAATLQESCAERSAIAAAPTEEEGRVNEVRHVGVASLELLVHTAAAMPDPATDPIIAAALCIWDDVCSCAEPTTRLLICSLSPDRLPRDECVVYAEDEWTILNMIIDAIRGHDPEMLVGYDTDRLSWGYAWRRALASGWDMWAAMGRWTDSGRGAGEARGGGEGGELNAPRGRLLLAAWRTVRADAGLRAYDAGTAARDVLRQRLPTLSNAALSQLIESFDSRQWHTALQHTLRLSLFNVSLMLRLNLFSRTAEMARVYGIQFEEVLTRGSQLRVESMMLRLTRRHGMACPSIAVPQRNRMAAPEQLQLVMEPRSGVYHDPVIVLDFQSLYPSMVIAYNYCYSTCLGKTREWQSVHAGLETIPVGAIAYHAPISDMVEATADRMVHISPLGAAFVKKEIREGVVPQMLREILAARFLVKAAMKHTKDKRLLRILDARQLALKLVANTTYGYTAANWSGRMPCVEVADAILGKGRETLERAIRMVHEGEYGGARVIYGDTDSMFVLVEGGTLHSAFEIGRRIAADVTAANPTPVVLKLEKVFMGCVLQTKKRYAGIQYESETDEGELLSKGIETIRRDTCGLVAKTLKRTLQLALTKQWDTLSTYLDYRLSNLTALPLAEFVFCKELRGHYSENAHVPQKRVADLRAAFCPQSRPLVGDRVAYVIVDGPPNATVLSCVRGVDEYVRDARLSLNYSYYVRAHVLPALNRVLHLVPIRVRWNPNKARHCWTKGCRVVGMRPWCVHHVAREAALPAALEEAAREEALASTCRKACKECTLAAEHCANYACTVNQVWIGLRRRTTHDAVRTHSAYEGADKKVVKWSF